jgi:hypothetical protein
MRVVNNSSEDIILKLAFNEGFANFFSVLAQEIQGVTFPPVINTIPRNTILEAYEAGDLRFREFDVETPDKRGEDNELAVMAILWDLFDTPNDGGRDQISMGVGPLFELLQTSKPLTLDQLWDALMSNAPDLATKLKYGEIFELNGVSPTILGGVASLSISPPTKTLTVMKADPAPTLVWSVPVAHDGTTPLLKKFGVRFFDDTGNEVFNTGYLPIGPNPGMLKVTGTQYEYVPDASTWAQVTNLVGSTSRKFRWVVYGSAVFSAFPPSSDFPVPFDTGPYWSGVGEVEVLP